MHRIRANTIVEEADSDDTFVRQRYFRLRRVAQARCSVCRSVCREVAGTERSMRRDNGFHTDKQIQREYTSTLRKSSTQTIRTDGQYARTRNGSERDAQADISRWVCLQARRSDTIGYTLEKRNARGPIRPYGQSQARPSDEGIGRSECALRQAQSLDCSGGVRAIQNEP